LSINERTTHFFEILEELSEPINLKEILLTLRDNNIVYLNIGIINSMNRFTKVLIFKNIDWIYIEEKEIEFLNFDKLSFKNCIFENKKK